MTDVWIVNDDGSEIVRARDVAVASLDYDGSITVRLVGGDGAVVTIVGNRAHHDEHRPDDFHRRARSASSPNYRTRREPSWSRPCTTRSVAGSGSPSRCDGEHTRSILVLMKPARAASRPPPTSPFRPAPPAPPAEQLAEDDQVTHDKYGLGRVISVQDGHPGRRFRHAPGAVHDAVHEAGQALDTARGIPAYTTAGVALNAAPPSSGG